MRTVDNRTNIGLMKIVKLQNTNLPMREIKLTNKPPVTSAEHSKVRPREPRQNPFRYTAFITSVTKQYSITSA